MRRIGDWILTTILTTMAMVDVLSRGQINMLELKGNIAFYIWISFQFRKCGLGLGLDYLIIFHRRVPEIVYQPSMLGIEQAGIAETIDFILNHFTAELQTALVQVLAVYIPCNDCLLVAIMVVILLAR